MAFLCFEPFCLGDGCLEGFGDTELGFFLAAGITKVFFGDFDFFCGDFDTFGDLDLDFEFATFFWLVTNLGIFDAFGFSETGLGLSGFLELFLDEDLSSLTTLDFPKS